MCVGSDNLFIVKVGLKRCCHFINVNTGPAVVTPQSQLLTGVLLFIRPRTLVSLLGSSQVARKVRWQVEGDGRPSPEQRCSGYCRTKLRRRRGSNISVERNVRVSAREKRSPSAFFLCGPLHAFMTACSFLSNHVRVTIAFRGFCTIRLLYTA